MCILIKWVFWENMEMLQRHREYVAQQQRKWQEYMQNLEEKIAFYQGAIEEKKI